MENRCKNLLSQHFAFDVTDYYGIGDFIIMLCNLMAASSKKHILVIQGFVLCIFISHEIHIKI